MYRKAKRPGRMHFVIDNSLVTHHIHTVSYTEKGLWVSVDPTKNRQFG